MSLLDLALGPRLLVLAGAAGAVYALLVRDRAVDMRRWPMVQGRIDTSRVLAEEERDDDGRVDTMYRPDVSYRFVVDGREYTSTRIGLGLAFAATSVRSDADSVVARYPEGRDVAVYYNRARPSDAILERNVAPARGTALLLGSSLLLAVGVVWWYAI